MRTGSQFLGPLPVIAFVLSSCAYDQALLGDPEREEMTEPIYVAESNDEFVAIDDYEGLPTDEPVEFEPSEQDGIITPADSLDMFDDLSFHGSWYWLDPHGWVWRPIVARTWKPMTQGSWAWTDYGWMWDTSDRFGSDPYNYGYWTEDTALGWVWVPECHWEPLRCQWMQWGDYVAWAPLPPPGDGQYRAPWELDMKDTPWVTVRPKKFTAYDVVRYRIPPKFNSETVRRDAPDIAMIEKATGRRIPTIDVPHRYPRVVIQPIVIVEPPCDDLIPEPPVYRVQPIFPDPPHGGGSDSGGKMKGNTPPPPPPQQKPSQPRNFKEAAQDPPPSKGKSKAK